MIQFNDLYSESSSTIKITSMTPPEKCPSVEELRRFLSPAPSAADDRALMDHCLECQSCQEKLDELAGQMALPMAESPKGHPSDEPLGREACRG